MTAGGVYWRRRWGGWRDGDGLRDDGYALLLPVPGDLPVFLDLALAICRTQKAEHRRETLVIPDQITPRIRRIAREAKPGWPDDLVLAPLPTPERWVLPRLHSTWRNHGLQLVTGVQRTRATHIVLHDADLFLLDPGMHDRQYRLCRDRDLDCLGVSPVWDGWFAERGIKLAATWELTVRTEWFRSFPPHLQFGHDAHINGETHSCDTTLHPQALTPRDRIDVTERDDDFVHFNYVIGTYREFQRNLRSKFVDRQFRLLLIGLFVEALDPDPGRYALPSVATMARSLAGGAGGEDRVGFPSPEEAADGYRAFRAKVEKMLQGSWFDPDRPARALVPFDTYYGYDAAT